MPIEGIAREVLELLSHAGVHDAAGDAARILDAGIEDALERARRRASGVPLGHLLGKQRFMGIDILCHPDVLAPRAETECLGGVALEVLRPTEAPRVIDMCCGSGNLVCAIATRLPRGVFWASDLCDPAVSLARRNVAALRLSERVTIAQGDLFAGLAEFELAGSIDAVVCNPPYISTGRLEKDRAQLLDHEPREAFDGGTFGIAIHQRVVREAPDYLRAGGWLLFEVGIGQARQVMTLFQRSNAYEESRTVSDEAGEVRVVFARKRS